VSQWRRYAGAGYREVWLEGARHSYVANPPTLLLETVRQELLSCAAGGRLSRLTWIGAAGAQGGGAAADEEGDDLRWRRGKTLRIALGQVCLSDASSQARCRTQDCASVKVG
ncbi:hypothetical protein MNEG_9197, partial [Monoraphidium neglectum]|jgi:hypothetical protein